MQIQNSKLRLRFRILQIISDPTGSRSITLHGDLVLWRRYGTVWYRYLPNQDSTVPTLPRFALKSCKKIILEVDYRLSTNVPRYGT